MVRDRLLADSRSAKQAAPASWWAWLRRRWALRRDRRAAARALYLALVEQAREPILYAELRVPDTREGRLEMVNLHALLVMRRLRAEGRPGADLAQELFGLLFADLDRHLREWGVGDLSVGKEIKKLAQSFFARVKAVDPLLAGEDPSTLEAVLRRNVYGEDAAAEPLAVRRLGAYLCAQDRWLAEQEGEALLAGRVVFAPVRVAAGA